MNSEDGGAEQHLVVPGDQIDAPPGSLAGSGVLRRGENLIATRLGRVRNNGETLYIEPTNTTNMPRSGDLVIGYVEAVQNNLWFLDVAGPFNALLPMSLAPWKVEFGAARQYMDYGDAVLARVMEVDETHSLVVTMKGVGLRKIKQGCIVQMPPHMLSFITGKQTAILQLIKESSDCRVIVGQNGRILIDGGVKGTAMAKKAFEIIKKSRHAPGLEDRLKEILGGDE